MGRDTNILKPIHRFFIIHIFTDFLKRQWDFWLSPELSAGRLDGAESWRIEGEHSCHVGSFWLSPLERTMCSLCHCWNGGHRGRWGPHTSVGWGDVWNKELEEPAYCECHGRTPPHEPWAALLHPEPAAERTSREEPDCHNCILHAWKFLSCMLGWILEFRVVSWKLFLSPSELWNLC